MSDDTAIVFTPYRRGAAISLGNQRWKKQLLPVGTVNYKGRKLQFTKDYLAGLVKAFRDRAFDQVPFQLATDKNEHTNDPERTRGTIVDLEQSPEGLYVVVEPNAAGQKVLETNPDLGVSARIYENYDRGDGKSFVAALQHVLGTLDPHITGMGPWQQLAESGAALSTQLDEPAIVDLTDEVFQPRSPRRRSPERREEVTTMSKEDERKVVREVLDGLTDEDLDLLGEEPETVDPEFDEAELTDDELDQLLLYAEETEDEGEEVESQDGEATEIDDNDDDEGEEGGDEEVTRIAASNADNMALELANARLAEQGSELSRVSAILDEQRFDGERRVFTEDLGIPPTAIDLARPLLEGAGHIVELAGGDTIDAGAIMRSVLTEIGRTIKILDLTALMGNGEDPGSFEDEQEREAQETETRDFVKTVRSTYSL